MLKKVVSLTLFFSLFFLLFTSLVVFVEPPVRIAAWADWTFLGLPRESWDAAHLGMGLLFAVAGVIHLALNWDTLIDHLRDADGAVVVFTKPLVFGAVISLAVFVGSLAGLPPARQLVLLSDFIKGRTAEIYGAPPYARAERASLAEFARRMGINQDKALALLRLRNIKADSADQTLAEIARANGVAPGGVFEALKMVMEPSGGVTPGLPKDPPPGLGRRKLSDICEEYGLDVKAVIGRLETAGLQAKPAWTLAEVARNNNALPITIYEVLRNDKSVPTPVAVEAPAARPAPAETAPQAPTPVQPGTTTETAPAPGTLPTAPPPGLEKMMLQTYCREYNIPLSTAVSRLAKQNITAFGDMTFEELSLENNRTPADILRLINGQE